MPETLLTDSTKVDTTTFNATPRLVQNQAALAPDALAIRAGSDRLTYRELDSNSNRLAHYLQRLGVGPNAVVAICIERSLRFPVAALAVLKLGAAYLPLEPKTPHDRLHAMLTGVPVSVVITDSSFPDALARKMSKIVDLQGHGADIALCPDEPLPIHVTAGQVAYVIYTSGSTGKPKAVAITHGNLLNLIQWHNNCFSVTAHDRASQVASIAFDAAVWEFWPHLVAGASVYLADNATRSDPESLRDWLISEQITVSFAATPLAERMINLPWPVDTKLRFLLTGADALHHYPPVNLPFPLVNNYGPTECTVVATSAVVSPTANSELLPPIGRPIANTRVYILDGNLKLVPSGKIGEIYLGGASVGCGYLNDPEVTAQKFLPDPFGTSPDATMYRTGDLGCWLPNGQIAFHGRIDDQVKICGHRIELNEIIGVLDCHPAIRENVVVAWGAGTGEKRLVAYIVAHNSVPTVSEIRDFLGNQLPTYMIPSTLVALDALPLGTNGKVNRTALPPPCDENMLRDEAVVRARTATEQRVADVVVSLLGIDSIGIRDNFFYLGGNSLFGTQVIASLRETFDIDLPLLRLFDCPTVEALSAEVERLIMAKVEAMSEAEAQRLLALNAERSSI
jgi:amino acid adenylation domain-containing protein